MTEYSLNQIRDLAEHIRAGKALCRHDLGSQLSEILDVLLAKIEYLESFRPKINYANVEMTCAARGVSTETIYGETR